VFTRSAAAAIRAPWAIETTSHDSRDVTMAEDRSRIRTNPGGFARLRGFAFNIPKANRANSLPPGSLPRRLAGIDCLLDLIANPER
jgi:hypothetical protein